MKRDVLENSFVEQYYSQAQHIIPQENQKNDPKYEEKIELIKECQEIAGTDLSTKPPLNIAIIGLPGGGKSSLLNTIFASFSTSCWEDIVQFGSFGTLGKQFTTRFKSFPKDVYYKPTDAYLMPTFLDMTGFEDEDSAKTLALLELVFAGRIREEEELTSAKSSGFNYFIRKGVCHRPVDRIIVVCTSNPDDNLPPSFFNAVWKAKKKHREIPVYGVMTFRDKYPPNNERVKFKIQEFRKHLALPQHRFAHIINYCDDIDSEGVHTTTTIPSLDVPVLQLMKQVLKTRKDDPTFPTEKLVNNRDILSMLAFIFAVLAFIYVLLISNS
ncbi:uncharacterized protein LOC127714303 [Mytilus californianus]|uniref:uncharacterized protein LOC127714303 n=1 Tax=Mytilus californianus TaxID=6549 RepID=UPI002247EED5|nr:uncharacterized protein LOC127714303 [Mytilus californianus]